ncbi:MAG: DUF2225 domain-containing protein [Oscillospiraceae bacterium]|nr:DUF2225 domain-containing protein [Oscillospiraceae bacterium]
MDNLNVQKFEARSVIVSDKSPKQMVVILNGSVGIYKNYKMTNETFIGSVEQGGFCCEQSLFLNKEHEETFVALSDVLALIVTRNDVNEFFAKYPDAAFSIVETIYSRLAEVTVELDKLKPKADTGQASQKSTLFPDGHGSYTLPLMHGKSDIIILNKVTCPLCERKFDSHYVLNSRLRQVEIEPDTRIRYKDVEPLYYSIITCPNCLFSAESTTFATAPKKYANNVSQKVAPYRLSLVVQTGDERDTFTVFAGFYLALLCVPEVFENHELTTAGLWLKLSRLYDDCKDEKMYDYAVRKALESYNYVYSNIRINDKQTRQVRCMIGELNFKTGDYDTARQFFFMLKADKETPSMLRTQAENRLETIREIKKNESNNS